MNVVDVLNLSKNENQNNITLVELLARLLDRPKASLVFKLLTVVIRLPDQADGEPQEARGELLPQERPPVLAPERHLEVVAQTARSRLADLVARAREAGDV